MGPIWSREVSKMAGRALNKLSAVQAAKITKPGRHSDGGGLYLFIDKHRRRRSEEHTSELQSLMRISYAVFCLKKKKKNTIKKYNHNKHIQSKHTTTTMH